MKHARRWKLSAAQRADMWNRWKAGQSLHAIGRALGKDHVVIQFLLARHGGVAPAARRRSRCVLTLAEREDISRGIASGSSMRVIAQRLRRACSTVSREVARHGGRAVSSQPSRSTGLGVGPAAQSMPAGHPQHVFAKWDSRKSHIPRTRRSRNWVLPAHDGPAATYPRSFTGVLYVGGS